MSDGGKVSGAVGYGSATKINTEATGGMLPIRGPGTKFGIRKHMSTPLDFDPRSGMVLDVSVLKQILTSASMELNEPPGLSCRVDRIYRSKSVASRKEWLVNEMEEHECD